MKSPDILIVDDEELERLLLQNILKKMGCKSFFQASSGQEALSMFDNVEPDILFLDINMPIEDGKENKSGLKVLSTLKSMYPDLFVIMISGDSTLENVKNSLSQGADGFIVKPYQKDKIKSILLKYINQSKQLFE